MYAALLYTPYKVLTNDLGLLYIFKRKKHMNLLVRLTDGLSKMQSIKPEGITQQMSRNGVIVGMVLLPMLNPLQLP
jgi:hypothetical protein